MDTLIQDPAQLLITFQDQDTLYPVIPGRYSCSETRRTAADYDNIIFPHLARAPFYILSLLVPTTSFESPPAFVISVMGSPSSR